MKSTNINLIIILTVVIIIACWLVIGPLFFEINSPRYSHWINLLTPSKTDNYESLFAPVAALFSGLAAAFTIVAIRHQSNQFAQQQFESDFFSLLTLHNEHKKNVTSEAYSVYNKDFSCAPSSTDIQKKEVSGVRAFRQLHCLLKAIFNTAKAIKNLEKLNLPMNVIDSFNEVIGQRLYTESEQSIPIEKIFTLSYEVFVESTNNKLYVYFRHLYHIIKYIDKYAPLGKAPEYMAILRAQFSPYEFTLIYYHALQFDKIENDGPQEKFKNYIENNCLMHNMQKELLFDDYAAGEYAEKAFTHAEDIKKDPINIRFREWINNNRLESILDKAVNDYNVKSTRY